MKTTESQAGGNADLVQSNSDWAPRSGDESGTQTDTAEGDLPLLSFFIPDLTVGGAEQVTVSIVNGLAERGHNVELLLSRFEGKLRAELSSEVRIVELPPSRTGALGVAAHFPALVTYLRRKEPAALFPHLEHPSVVCLTINRFLNVDTAVIPTHHSSFGESVDQTPKDRVVGRLIPQLYPASDWIIAVSDGVADSITERTPVGRDDLSVLHNPVDVDSVRRRAREPVDQKWIEDDDTDVVLFVGRLADQKNLETWLHAFKRVHDRNSRVRGVIAGQGPCHDELQSLTAELSLSDAVSLPGYVDNPYRYMGQADVFLLSSRYEGLPTVLIEALAVGCPIVATDCPSGPREILEDGKYGHLVPVDDRAGLADAVAETLESPRDPDALRARADDFSPESVLDDYEQFLEKHVVST